MNNNLAVSLVIEKILPVCYKKHPYHSYGFLAGFFFFLRVCCQQFCSFLLVRSENPGVCAAELRPRAKPGYVIFGTFFPPGTQTGTQTGTKTGKGLNDCPSSSLINGERR